MAGLTRCAFKAGRIITLGGGAKVSQGASTEPTGKEVGCLWCPDDQRGEKRERKEEQLSTKGMNK